MSLPRRTLLTSLAVGATAVALGGRPARAEEAAPGTPTDPIVVATAPTGRMAFFPDMIRLADGRLLVGYRDSVSHIAQDGRILVVESSDDGRTWSAPRVAVDTAIDDRDPKLVQLRDGTILMNFFRTDWTGYPDQNPATLVGSFVVRSTDGGATWSEPVQVGTAMSGPSEVIVGAYYAGHAATHGPILELPDGDLLVPLYGRLPEGGRGPATVVRSSDGGLTWPAETEAFIGHTAELDFQEPNLSLLRDGTLLSILRTSVNRAFLSWSDDGGRSWSDPVDSGLPASSHHQLRLRGGAILFTYGDPSGKINSGRPTLGRILRHPERGIGDEREVLIYDAAINGAPTSDQANPSSVAFSPGRYFTVTSDPYLKSIVGVYTELGDYLRRS